ncbi:hypothetical protein [Acidovorax sp.]|uniref:hypothetical protein n=1 Tax=Acidovorax sp. TaxID=1872122 RepID=UPI0039187F12
MLNDERRTIEESYASATASSDLRCDTRDGAPRSDTDLLIAAGWSPSRIGAALLRLHTEWDGSERGHAAVASDFLGQAALPRSAVNVGPRSPMLDKREQVERAEKLATEHNKQQAKLLMAHLKTMPVIREQLTLQLLKWKVENAEQVAGALLRWWLAPNCHACQGRKFETIPDTGRLSSKQCKPCGATGKLRIPHGEAGRRLANFMDDCVGIARNSIKKRLHTTIGCS